MTTVAALSLSQSQSLHQFLPQSLPHSLPYSLPETPPQSPSLSLPETQSPSQSLVVILNFDAGTFCALPWLLLKIYTRAYLGTCFAILLPVPAPSRSPTFVDSSCPAQLALIRPSTLPSSCVVSHLYGHHKL